MITNLTSVINNEKFKAIPDNIESPHDVIKWLIPEGFEDLIQSRTDGYEVSLTTVNDDPDLIIEIPIKSTLFNPGSYSFPKFIFTDLKRNLMVINQNQLFHLMLCYQFNKFRPMKRPYLNLITQDIKTIMRYINYTTPNTYNAKRKVNNLNVFIPYRDIGQLSSDFINIVRTNSVSEKQWKSLTTYNSIAVSSIGSMSSSNAVVLPQDGKQQYRGAGYKELKDGFVSIFPGAQNIGARLQTHLLGEAYPIKDYSQSCIQQDNIVVDGQLVPKDKCLKKAIVVFAPIEDNLRLVSGEIEINKHLADQLLTVSVNIEECFASLNIEIGKTYYPDYEDYVIGLSLLQDEVVLKDFKEFTVTDIVTTGINNSRKIRIKGLKRSGNARIISNTGLKGVTKVRNNLGEIEFNVSVNDGYDDFESEVAVQQQYAHLDLNSFNDYPRVTKSEKLKVKPDIVCGMNSTKAKVNTMALARACLAVELGFYEPKEKHGFKGLLNSLDEKEINEACNSLPEYTYKDCFGNEVPVQVGVVYIMYTEICNIYTKVKPQSFSFESGRFLHNDGKSSKALYDYIWSNYLDEEKLEVVKELYQIYMLSETQMFHNPDNLPVYNLDEINKTFDTNDLVLTTMNQFPSDSKLLDEDFNKGFFIDLTKYENAPLIRIPSAKTLKMFSGTLKNGDTIYHINLINASKILRGCFKTENGYALNTVYSKNKERWTTSLAYNAYILNIKSTIYSGEDASQQMVQNFIKPQILGCNLKQLNEALLPDDTVVITDDNLYRKLKRESLKGSGTTIEEHEVMLCLLMKQFSLNSVDEQKRLFEELDKDTPLALAVRSPSLWKTQNIKVKIWDRFMYEAYLKLYKGLSINQVINTHYNRDVLLCATNILITSHGDSDGDILPVFVLDYLGQLILRDYKLEDVLVEEQHWHEAYKAKEKSNNSVLDKEMVYKLYKTSYKDYSNYLINAVVAKGNIGKATLDIWAWSMILECYKAYYKDNNGCYYKKDKLIPLVPLDEHEEQLLSYIYCRLVQEMVIEGIKHTLNGSKDFDIYFLKSIGDKSNEKKIRHDLTRVFNLDSALVDKLLFIVRFADDNHELSKACRNFISLYNKGRFPMDPEALDHWEDYVANNTYFGSLVLDLFNIKQSYYKGVEENTAVMESLLASLAEPVVTTETEAKDVDIMSVLF